MPYLWIHSNRKSFQIKLLQTQLMKSLPISNLNSFWEELNNIIIMHIIYRHMYWINIKYRIEKRRKSLRTQGSNFPTFRNRKTIQGVIWERRKPCYFEVSYKRIKWIDIWYISWSPYQWMETLSELTIFINQSSTYRRVKIL